MAQFRSSTIPALVPCQRHFQNTLKWIAQKLSYCLLNHAWRKNGGRGFFGWKWSQQIGLALQIRLGKAGDFHLVL